MHLLMLLNHNASGFYSAYVNLIFLRDKFSFCAAWISGWHSEIIIKRADVHFPNMFRWNCVGLKCFEEGFQIGPNRVNCDTKQKYGTYKQ